MDDSKDVQDEASNAVAEINPHVLQACISEVLQSDNLTCYLNITTKDELKFCIQLNSQGYQIVGREYDQKSDPGGTTYESVYTLLSEISPAYRDSFASSLAAKLKTLE